ncbi:hypothetical protein TraAM80_09963 [Trypanosoma rangeli]|uniref:Nodulin-like domain-containing protein n=1 Tax=Trypanosoma rangeli TaxID=5698 RepID=A0A422MSE4_TRYRA|nr:uncharacterized protein TraAM80_09963 [Trypanosoma rangeli]RNE96121.1 hypothetical protein TraAM80_09963 [Trypanosoma rangeli]|eukprot:RNE96121.1 hypothetical protein TraAM80_09963 [Trypanosoma rangeli]
MPGEALVEHLATGSQKPISEPHRFFILVIGAFGSLCSSLSYAFNLISMDMQSRYHLSGRDISTIITVGLVISYFLVPYGFLYDHFGPKPIFALSTTLFLLGAFLFALTFRGTIEGSVVRLSVFNVMLSLGSTLFDVGCLMTVMSHFPASKGAAVAIMKSCLGLGSAIVGSIQLAFFDGSPDIYFYFLMALVLVVGVANFFLLTLPPYILTGYEENHLSAEEKEHRLARRSVYLRQQPPRIRFIVGLAVVVVLVVYLPLQSALSAYLKLGNTSHIIFAVVIIVLVAILPVMALPVPWMERKGTKQIADGCKWAENRGAGDDELNEPVTEDARSTHVETDIDYIAPQYQTTFMENVRTLKVWALLWCYFCPAGAQIVVIFNANFIYAALAGEEVNSSVKTLLTVLTGVGSAVGRLAMSYFEVWSQSRKAEDRIPITVTLFGSIICAVLSTVLFLVLPKAALLLPYFIASLGNGFSAATVVLVARTLFAKDHGKHYNFFSLLQWAPHYY